MAKKNIIIENAEIGFRNFSGEAGKYNPAGNRNFCVFLEQDVAQQLAKDGWNVRYLTPKDEGEELKPYMAVAVSYDNTPPKIVLISSRGKQILDEASVNMLDWVEIKMVDIIINPYDWSVNGKTGTKAYLKTMYLTIVEDELEKKYYDAPDSAVDAIGGCGNCAECDGNCGCNAHSTL